MLFLHHDERRLSVDIAVKILDETPKVAIITPEFKYCGQTESEELVRAYEQARGLDALHIILDLGRVTHLNAVAIGNLVGLHSAVQTQGGKVILVNVDRRIQNVFVVTKLSLVFEVAKSREEALQYIRDGSSRSDRR